MTEQATERPKKRAVKALRERARAALDRATGSRFASPSGYALYHRVLEGVNGDAELSAYDVQQLEANARTASLVPKETHAFCHHCQKWVALADTVGDEAWWRCATCRKPLWEAHAEPMTVSHRALVHTPLALMRRFPSSYPTVAAAEARARAEAGGAVPVVPIVATEPAKTTPKVVQLRPAETQPAVKAPYVPAYMRRPALICG